MTSRAMPRNAPKENVAGKSDTYMHAEALHHLLICLVSEYRKKLHDEKKRDLETFGASSVDSSRQRGGRGRNNRNRNSVNGSSTAAPGSGYRGRNPRANNGGKQIQGTA